jgi:hypothetical protein
MVKLKHCAYAASVAMASILASSAAVARPLVSVVYCQSDGLGGRSYFAAQERRDGSLGLSLSIWGADGHLASLIGVARPASGGWIYRSARESSKPGRPCIAEIRVDGAKGVRIKPKPIDACDGGQGYGATIGDVTFPAGAYAGHAPNDTPNVNEDDLGARCDELSAGKPRMISDAAWEQRSRQFLEAVAGGDRKSALSLTSFPLTVNDRPGHSVRIANAAALLAAWDRVFTPAFLKAIRDRKMSTDFFIKEDAACIGPCYVWFAPDGAKVINLP